MNDSKRVHLVEAIRANVQKYGERAAFKYQSPGSNEWVATSWKSFGEKIDKLAKSLIKLGVKSQETIGIFSQNMPQWSITDLGALSVKAITVPIYATNTAEQASYILKDAAVRVLFVGEQDQLDKSLEILDQHEELLKIVAFEKDIDLRGCQKAIHFDDLIAQEFTAEEEAEYQERLANAKFDDLLTLIYTSGTTGTPKGVMLDYSNFAKTFEIHDIRVPVNESDHSLCFLPLSHVYERTWSFYVYYNGATNFILKDPKQIAQAIPEVAPTAMCSVPRLYEKIHTGILQKAGQATGVKKKLFDWAIATGLEFVEHKIEGTSPSIILKAKNSIADKLIFSKLRNAIFGGQPRLLPVGGSKLSDEITKFMHAIGLPINYGYGMTETVATVSCFVENETPIGSIGTPMPDVQIKIGDNNEILVKSETVMKGYYNLPEATAEVFTEDGWFRTGDAGYIDSKGHMVLTDRIKDLMKTSGGKYIAPQLIEAKISNDQFVEQIAVIGDERKYVSALIVPAFEALEEYAKNMGIMFKNRKELIENVQIKEMFDQRIEELQKSLAKFEKIKKFTLLPAEFTIEKGEITPTLKVKRKVVIDNYKKLIEKMYKH
ncbi:AMP-dependent synthetase/ligase [Sediminitomix flava]|uniref:Long-chain acyl-CoA synthetase n=1 Tax=Sediminitomix flava TaxID=379075 RepID=A0A315ZEB0_SEDFL|nr:long-chain fatty acid--CoA ligase [Sediminitomix flava]PWJ43672.1 long-chain acyl-CoA synthetase [Sediminitomix flava]